MTGISHKILCAEIVSLLIRRTYVKLVRRKLILAFGNPILDLVVKLQNRDIIKKFGLQEDGHKQTSHQEIEAIFDEVKTSNYDWIQVPGGSALNTMRILQWFYGTESSTLLFGSVGADANSEILKDMVESYKVITKFAKIEGKNTGWVLSLVHGATRSLVANLGAAEKYRLDHFLSSDDNKSLIQCSDLVYMEGFFITERREVSRYIMEEVTKKQKIFAFNLNAEYLISNYQEDLLYFAERCHILFGNRTEFSHLAEALNLMPEELIQKLVCDRKDKILVITNGPKRVSSYTMTGEAGYDVPMMKSDKIVDTTGCGDSFVAGFIYGYLNGMEPLRCIKWGSWMAQQVITQIGCVPPPDLAPNEIQKVL